MRVWPGILLLLSISPATAEEPDWQLIWEDPEVKVFVAAASYERADEFASALTQADYAEPRVLPGGERYTSMRNVIVFDCAKRRMALRSGEAQYADDSKRELVASVIYDAPDWADVESGTLGAKMLEFVCKHAPAE